jgi:glutathione S-transferase
MHPYRFSGISMQLHGSYTSPYVRHCRIALQQSGLQHELINTDYQQSMAQSPTAKVPFLRDGDLLLTDSTSILRHVRERSGQSFCSDIKDFDLYLLASTALDSAVNLFLLERDDVTPASSDYLKRQQQRIQQCLQHMDQIMQPLLSGLQEPFTDGVLRVGCFLSWALYRERLGIAGQANLQKLMQQLDEYASFAATHPSIGPTG